MRELILKRIEEIRTKEQGFPKSLMRWVNFIVTWGDGSETHISKIDFQSLDDDRLLNLFERIVRVMSKQM
jgi:hypothetical protein